MVINKNNFDTNIGNKAKNLIWLQKNNLPVPSFSVVLLNDLINDYDLLIQNLSRVFLNNKYGDIDAILNNVSFNEKNINRDILKLNKYYNKKVSFRTSAGMEDLKKYSFAGIYESFLNISFNKDSFEKYLLLCLKSLFTQRVFSYIEKKGLKIKNFNLSIIVQEMFDAKISGISFSDFPFSETKIVINKGLAKSLVDGSSADEYIINRKTKLSDYPLKIKQAGLINEFEKLLKNIEKITYLKSTPQDIEWSVSNKRIAILQTRDITIQIKKLPTQKITFDCTNISESYPGTTTPLTYSFIQYAYSKVYANFMRLVGVDENIINDKNKILKNLLGYVDGRVYYKIHNWYKMIKVLPGYKYNKGFFEAMLVPQKKISKKETEKNKTKIKQIISSMPVILKFSYKLIFYKKDAQKFIKNFDKDFQKHKDLELQKFTPTEIVEHYKELEEHFLDKWKVPILNDFRLMIFHGILDKIISKSITSNNQDYLNILISNFKRSDELKVIEEISFLSEKIKESQKIISIFSNKNDKKIYSDLLISSDKEVKNFKKLFDRYINKYGSRRPSELKLESVRIEERPEFIINILKNFSDVNLIKNKKNIGPEIMLKIKKEIKKNNKQLSGLMYYFLIKFLSNYTKKSIQLREVFRLRRGMIYTVARDYFLALGNNFSLNGIISDKEDVFYLRKEEVFNIANCNTLEKNYLDIIENRKKLLKNYRNKKLPKRLIINDIGEKSYIQNDEVPDKEYCDLKGLSTSGGTIEGEVIVLKEFDINTDYKNKILVTYQTDPGWTIIFPLLKGIILEKGNTLSHAAIISRELGIPCVVRVNNAVELIKNKDKIILDGNSGIIKILSNE